jgi:hypothetical protein
MKPLYRFFLILWGILGLLVVAVELLASRDTSWAFVISGTFVSGLFLVVGIRKKTDSFSQK